MIFSLDSDNAICVTDSFKLKHKAELNCCNSQIKDKLPKEQHLYLTFSQENRIQNIHTKLM